IMGKTKPPPAPEARSETPESSIRRFPFANTMDADLAAAIAESEKEEWRRLTGDAKAKGLQSTTERSTSRQSQRSGGTRPSTPDPRFEYMGESSPSRTSSQSGNVGKDRSEEV